MQRRRRPVADRRALRRHHLPAGRKRAVRLHHLPDDPALYEEYNFLAFIQARKKLLQRHLPAVLQAEKPPALPGAPLAREAAALG